MMSANDQLNLKINNLLDMVLINIVHDLVNLTCYICSLY